MDLKEKTNLDLETLKNQIIQWVGSDASRRRMLHDSPKSTIKGIIGQEIPENIRFRIEEDSCSIVNIVLPPLTEINSSPWS
jgi:hypothetical protein